MSSMQVPEIRQLPIQEQMRRLEVWVNNHRELFEKYRNTNVLNHFGAYAFLKPDRSASPTEDMRQFNSLVGDVRVLRKALAVFYRDGCNVAAKALWGALLYTDDRDRPHRLPFEDELPAEKEPMVLLMFDPKRMLEIMQWLPKSFMQLDAMWKEQDIITPTEATKRIVKLLPSLKQHWEETQGPEYPKDVEIFRAIRDDVLKPFGGVQQWFDPRPGGVNQVTALYDDGTPTHKAYEGVAIAYLFRGLRQKDVLSRIPRALQSQVATWQFEVYHKVWFGIPRHQIMLIPEAELPQWQGICQSALSKGAAAGYAAVYDHEGVHDRVFSSLPDGSERDMESTFRLHSK